MVKLMNIAVTIILLLIVLSFILIGLIFGFGYGVAFALGWAASTLLWQYAHKSRYGNWFRPPLIKG
jgi:hypothetical protein